MVMQAGRARIPVTANCATLWIGDSLGPVERACLRSVIATGHSLALYCYAPVAGIPDGVEVRDAGSILPMDDSFIHKNGSVAPFSDWFRLELQKRSEGIWVDTDMYMLKPLDAQANYLFGEEEPGEINNSVLRIPPDSQLLQMLLEIFETRRVPAWLPMRFTIRARLRELVGAGDLSRLPFGVTGPFALTAAAKRLGLASKALGVEAFNPVRWQRASWILDPAISLESVISERTIGVHLWNECIKGFKNDPAPKGSFLSRLHEEGQA